MYNLIWDQDDGYDVIGDYCKLQASININEIGKSDNDQNTITLGIVDLYLSKKPINGLS